MTRLIALALLAALSACKTAPTQDQVNNAVQGTLAAYTCYQDVDKTVKALPPGWQLKTEAAIPVAATDPACQAAIAAAVKAVPTK